MVDVARHSDNHRTTVAHFLNCGKWDDELLEKAVKQIVIDTIYWKSKRTGETGIMYY